MTEPSAGPLHLKRESLPESIANAIATAIAARRLVAGERIVETALAAQLDVSRVPVREALKVLHTQGIIAGGGHRGYRVASFSPRMIQSVQEARLGLETLMLRDAVRNWHAGTADPRGLDAVIKAMRLAAKGKDFAGMLRADLDFHDAVCAAAENPIFATLWSAISRHVMIILNLARYRDIDLRLVVRRHEALRDQIMQRLGPDPCLTELRALLEAHFQSERPAHLVSPAEVAADADVGEIAVESGPPTGPEPVTPRASRRRRADTTPS